MDFLDPAKKRKHSVLLWIGYILMAGIVVFGTLILVFYVYGFNVDRTSGQVIQNGLVFVDSAPDGATIKINNEQRQGTTDRRLVLNEGNHTLRLEKAGYHSWQRDFTLEGGRVSRFTYPLLFPVNLVSSEVQSFDTLPGFGSQSPDRRWVVLSQPGSITNFTLYDLTSLEQKKPTSSSLSLPAELLSDSTDPQSWELVEWSSDNKHLLAKHIFGSAHEFIVINRENPIQSINVNKQLALSPTKVTMRDKRFDRLYLYDQADKSLKTADLGTKVVTPLLSGVLSYKSHGDNIVLYSTILESDPMKARILLRSDLQTYVLRDIPLSENMPLEIARFDGRWYAVVASEKEQKTYVYKDPELLLKRRTADKPATAAILKSAGPISVLTFSGNTRMLMVHSGQHFSVYDAENDEIFNYDLAESIDPGSKPVWMDGHRILARSGGKIVVMDFDGINKHTLTAVSSPALPTFFDRDYTVMYNLNPARDTTKHALTRTELRVLND